jgi:hypothetical protein
MKAVALVMLLLAAGVAVAQTALRQRPTGQEAVIGVMDKRLGTSAEFRLKPGEQFRFGRLSGTLRGCERTAPWEPQPEEGAFVQLVETTPPRTRQDQAQARTIFSGWLFARSPSLNPLSHPVYDVWLKACAMDFPDGPKSAPPDRTRSTGAGPGTAGSARVGAAG